MNENINLIPPPTTSFTTRTNEIQLVIGTKYTIYEHPTCYVYIYIYIYLNI